MQIPRLACTVTVALRRSYAPLSDHATKVNGIMLPSIGTASFGSTVFLVDVLNVEHLNIYSASEITVSELV